MKGKNLIRKRLRFYQEGKILIKKIELLPTCSGIAMKRSRFC